MEAKIKINKKENGDWTMEVIMPTEKGHAVPSSLDSIVNFVEKYDFLYNKLSNELSTTTGRNLYGCLIHHIYIYI